MSEKPPSKDEALEALDFIVNVLKEHEKDLDRLVSELGTVADQMGENGEVNVKVKKIEDKLTNLQADISNLMKAMAPQENNTQPTDTTPAPQTASAPNVAANTNFQRSSTLLLHCNQWEDFQNLSITAQAAAFTCKETDKTFQVAALKNNQIITYNGQIPSLPTLLKIYLSKQIAISEKQILEGTIGPK